MKNKIRIFVFIGYIAVGFAIIICSFKGKISSAFSGLGGGLIASSFVLLLREIKYKVKKEYREQADINENDERNQLIGMKAWYYTGNIFIILSGIACVVLVFMSMVRYAQILMIVISAITFIYFICFLVIKKKM